MKSPYKLWLEAGADPVQYVELMKQEGHLVSKETKKHVFAWSPSGLCLHCMLTEDAPVHDVGR